MTTRSLWARLRKLEKAQPPVDKFGIDVEIARTLWNLRERLHDLYRRENAARYGGVYTDADADEAERLQAKRAHIHDRFTRPESYDWQDALADRKREFHLTSTTHPQAIRSEAQKIEEGRIMIRLAAWERSSEYEHRREFTCLKLNKDRYEETGEYAAWEQERYDHLLAKYPDALIEFERTRSERLDFPILSTGPRKPVWPVSGYGKDGPYDWLEYRRGTPPRSAGTAVENDEREQG